MVIQNEPEQRRLQKMDRNDFFGARTVNRANNGSQESWWNFRRVFKDMLKISGSA